VETVEAVKESTFIEETAPKKSSEIAVVVEEVISYDT
jgi:hypothetical protein